jgi:hypothetical protein
MLVHCWGILCTPMSTKLPVSKVTAIVRCLCRLHNFCIDESFGREGDSGEVDEPLDSDEANIVLGGGSSLLVAAGDSTFLPEALLHGGDHFDDVSRAE